MAITCLVDPNLKLAGKPTTATMASGGAKSDLSAIDSVFGSSQVL